MIEINGIHKNFGKHQVLNDVNLTFNAGECIAMIGPNGCGKTTLIKSILGMVIPSKGNIKVKNKDISENFSYRKHIGYMPQIGRYPDFIRVGDLLDMITEIRKPEEETDRELYHNFNLEAIGDKYMRSLSGGTIQKVSATLAFLFRPEILILDEPTAGLDVLSSEILKEKIIREKNKGKLIIITSHLLSELDELISRVVFMQEGRIYFHHSTDELKTLTGEEKISKSIAGILKKGIK